MAMATLIVPDTVPSPREDAEKIRKAVKGFGTNEKEIIWILGHRNAEQRKQIRLAYEELYHEDLVKRLESELTGHFERAVNLWIQDPVERDAILAHVALKNLAQDYKVIIEIACELSPDDLLAVKRAYQRLYKSSLEEDVASQASGDLRKILVGLVSTYRYDGVEVNARVASSEADVIHNAIEEKVFNYGDVIRILSPRSKAQLNAVIRILSTRSKAQLNATFNRYRDAHGVSIGKALLGETGDEFLNALHMTVRCIADPTKYFEKVIRNALSKAGTDEDDLTRAIVRHAERNLGAIKAAYYKRNSVALEKAVAKETSGDYEAFLLALLGVE